MVTLPPGSETLVPAEDTQSRGELSRPQERTNLGFLRSLTTAPSVSRIRQVMPRSPGSHLCGDSPKVLLENH